MSPADTGRPRATDHLEEIAQGLARGLPTTEIAAANGLSRRQVRSRIDTIRHLLVDTTNEARWLSKAKLVDCGRAFLRQRGIPLPAAEQLDHTSPEGLDSLAQHLQALATDLSQIVDLSVEHHALRRSADLCVALAALCRRESLPLGPALLDSPGVADELSKKR